jgi:hypothetical protein
MLPVMSRHSDRRVGKLACPFACLSARTHPARTAPASHCACMHRCTYSIWLVVVVRISTGDCVGRVDDGSTRSAVPVSRPFLAARLGRCCCGQREYVTDGWAWQCGGGDSRRRPRLCLVIEIREKNRKGKAKRRARERAHERIPAGFASPARRGREAEI